MSSSGVAADVERRVDALERHAAERAELRLALGLPRDEARDLVPLPGLDLRGERGPGRVSCGAVAAGPVGLRPSLMRPSVANVGEQALRRRVRAERARVEQRDELRDPAVALPRQRAAQDLLAGEEEPALVDVGAPRGHRAAGVERGAVGVDRIAQRDDALAGQRAGRQDRHLPIAAPRGHGPHRQHRLEVGDGAVGVGPVALADDVDVGDLEDAGLDRLDVVAQPGRRDDDRRVRRAHDLDLVLAHADRLDDDDVVSPPRRARRPRPACRARARRARRAWPCCARRRRDRRPARPSGCGRRGSRRRRTGDDGSIATMPTRRPVRRISAASFATSVDLPLPGTPVMPTTCARPAWRKIASSAGRHSSSPASARVSSRAIARTSPASTPGTRSSDAPTAITRRPRVARSSRGTPRGRR